MLPGSNRLTLLLSLTLVASVSAQEKTTHGTLQSIDPEVGTLSIAREPKGQLTTFSLFKKDIPVTNTAGDALKVTDLKPKHRLALTVANEEDVVAIRLESDLDWGVITSVDVAGKEVIAHLGQMPRPFKLTDKMRVSIDGKTGADAKLSEVKPWSHGLKVLLTPDRTAVKEVWIDKSKYHSNPYCRRFSVAGVLTSHDPVKKTLSLVTTDRYQSMEFEYDSWTQLRLMHHFQQIGNVPVSELKSPSRVTIGYESDTRRAAVISVELPNVLRRHVVSLDLASRKLALASSDDAPAETFVIAPDAKVTRDGKQVRKLADVRENYVVTLGLSLDQKKVLYLSYVEK